MLARDRHRQNDPVRRSGDPRPGVWTGKPDQRADCRSDLADDYAHDDEGGFRRHPQRRAGSQPGLVVTLVVNWLVKPFSMALLAWFFFRLVLPGVHLRTAEADQYIAGCIILAAAPCTAMVFVWSHLTNGDPAYTLVQVSVNDLIMLVAFVPHRPVPGDRRIVADRAVSGAAVFGDRVHRDSADCRQRPSPVADSEPGQGMVRKDVAAPVRSRDHHGVAGDAWCAFSPSRPTTLPGAFSTSF